jgi:hypothetical protein
MDVTHDNTVGYPVDTRDSVIGPLPTAAPPVLGEWAAEPPALSAPSDSARR